MPNLSANYPALDQCLAPHMQARRWLVALSGGLDSTVLLHLLQAWVRSHADAPPLVALHVNHNMQTDAPAFQQHCEQLCQRWQVPLICACVTVQPQGKGAEAAARVARYAAFEAELTEGDVLFQGHHLDDQIETFFLRLLRGSGLQGLAAMPGQRQLGPGLLVRPLLSLAQDQLQAYAKAESLSFIDDPSNDDISLDRNYLRREVLPQLASRWPAYRQTVARAAAHIDEAGQLIEQNLELPPVLESALGDPGIGLSFLPAEAPEVAMLQLRRWLQGQACLMPEQQALAEFVRQLAHAEPAAAPQLDCGSYRLQRYREAVYLLRLPREFVSPTAISLGQDEAVSVAGVGVLALERAADSGIALAPGESLTVRWRSAGERCRPHGRAHSQSLKKLLQERAVPPWWRQRVPLLYLESELLAVGDLWLCESTRWGEKSDDTTVLWQLKWQRNVFPFD